MNKKQDNGGQAFPFQVKETQYLHGFYNGGMTLRDFFAAKALPAVYTNCVADMEKTGFPDENWRDGVALDVWMMADAMLRARGAA